MIGVGYLDVNEKEAIAMKAAELVGDGDSLFIDLGTTTLMFAKHLKKKAGLKIITNSILVAMELMDHPSAKVILCGGEIRSGELSLSGPVAYKSIEVFFADKAIIGVGGLALDHGITDYHVEEADIRRLMMLRSKETIALADASKFDTVAFSKVSNLGDIHTVVTDRRAEQKTIQKIQKAGVKVIIADE